VIADYVGAPGTLVWNTASTTWNTTTNLWNNIQPITFKLWANKELVLTTIVSDSDIFRLPNGYLTDTFEVEVSGNLRVRAIHLAETPTGLRNA